MIKNNTIFNLLENNKILFNYDIKSKIESGIVLQGWEVKSFFYKKVDISNCYIKIKNNEAFLINSIFNPISNISNIDSCITNRNRKLLLNKDEIYKLYIKSKIKGFAIVVLSIYFKNSFIKLNIGIAKGINKYDKRENIKNREWDRKKLYILKKSNKNY
ncbi:ssrA-binding protein [endosymbiont of Sipalinus gigas]|uniref:SsrA-binding protein SmpB n=1 Tax=endosymbiont of Sipalinus gigas TaxID=1972134 RepID=UPI000DC72745|nr:SsrA-binding protein SmpB [endosymbiont of Sipalinus gigas]BBA85197.1 ssrA-binding protein [endosymbiont of Sipalinus gigas]